MKQVIFVAGAHYIPAYSEQAIKVDGTLYVPADGSNEIINEKFDDRNSAVQFICDQLNKAFPNASKPWTPDEIYDGVEVNAMSGEWMHFAICTYNI